MPVESLVGKVVWITGAGSGIGEALAREFAARGARLVLSGRREAELVRVAAACVRDAGVPLVFPLDLTRPQDFARAASRVQEHFERIDVLVNNAGVSQRALVLDTLPAVERAILEVNFFGAAGLTRAVLPVMLAQRAGTIVALSSVMGHVGTPKRSAYAAAKHALHGWFDSLREEIRGDGVRVLIACPGYVRTPIGDHALHGDGATRRAQDAEPPRGIDPAVCARAIVDAVERGREEVTVGGRETWAILLKRLSPALYRWALRREIARGRF